MLNTKQYELESFEFYDLLKQFHSLMNVVLEEIVSLINKEKIAVIYDF